MRKIKQSNKTAHCDFIHIHGLRLKCRIGVSERERRKKQTIIADIALKCDLNRSGKSDRLKDTIDYSVIVRNLKALVAKKTFGLLESLAGHIAHICLADSSVMEVVVKVSKSGLLPDVCSVSVEIQRAQSV